MKSSKGQRWRNLKLIIPWCLFLMFVMVQQFTLLGPTELIVRVSAQMTRVSSRRTAPWQWGTHTEPAKCYISLNARGYMDQISVIRDFTRRWGHGVSNFQKKTFVNITLERPLTCKLKKTSRHDFRSPIRCALPLRHRAPHFSGITPKHDDVRDHNKPGARCIAGEMRGPAGEADGKQAVRNALAVV